MILRTNPNTAEVWASPPVDESGDPVTPGTGSLVLLDPLLTEGGAIDMDATEAEVERILASEEPEDVARVLRREE